MRALERELGESVRVTYVMGGLAREFGGAERLVGEWLDASDRTGMPVDPRLWLEGAPASSFPACLAVKAAAEQGDPGPYLRRLREGLLCGRRRLDTTEALVEEARGVPGLEVERFRIDLRSNAIVEALGADLDRAAAATVRGGTGANGRVPLPSVELVGPDGSLHGVYGLAELGAYRDAARAAGAEGAPAPAPDVESALRRLGRAATAEVGAACDLPGPRAAAELWRLASEWRVRAERRGTGELWSVARALPS